MVSGVAGFRGAVSLAAAIAVPDALASGRAFPDRDVIVFVTAGVIVVTLVLQGLALPRVVRWAQLPRDTAVDEERQLAETLATEEALAALPRVVRWAQLPRDTAVDEERQLAETLATEEALAALPRVAADLGTDQDVVDRLRREYEEHLRVVHARGASVADEPVLRHDRHYTALRLALLARKRATVLRLRDEHRIDDTVLRQVQSRLDIEEVRLARRELAD